MKPHELQGKTFNRLTVLKLSGDKTKSGELKWLCRCSCGEEVVLPSTNIKTGKTKSCGCLAKDTAKARLTKHGKARTKEYYTWHHMKLRCLDKTNPQYKDYGGRGIRVCERWLEFENFLADMGECPHGYFIDRIDNDGNYEPNNCRWVDRTTNNNNRRNSIKVGGRSISEIAQELEVSRDVMKSRIKRNPDLFVDIY